MTDPHDTDSAYWSRHDHGAAWAEQDRDPDYGPRKDDKMTDADGQGVYLTHKEYVALLAERDYQTERLRLAIERAEKAENEREALEAENRKLRGALTGHQVWDKAEKVSEDEFVLWAPDGNIAVRLKITHVHEQLSSAGLEFLTCDLLDLLNSRAVLAEQEKTDDQ